MVIPDTRLCSQPPHRGHTGEACLQGPVAQTLQAGHPGRGAHERPLAPPVSRSALARAHKCCAHCSGRGF